jgi:hypothetical protein
LTPKLRNGVTAGKPTQVEFGAGSGELTSPTAGPEETAGATTVLGFNEQETISTKTP